MERMRVREEMEAEEQRRQQIKEEQRNARKAAMEAQV